MKQSTRGSWRGLFWRDECRFRKPGVDRAKHAHACLISVCKKPPPPGRPNYVGNSRSHALTGESRLPEHTNISEQQWIHRTKRAGWLE